MKGRFNSKIGIFILLIFILGLVTILWGCPGQVPGTRGEQVGPKHHLWKPLTSMLAEDEGFGMYTYVLFGRKLKPMGRLGTGTLERYEQLLAAIHGSTLSAAEAGRIERTEANIFIIPMTADVAQPTRHNYNAILSLRYISLLSGMVRDQSPKLSSRLGTAEGPFLISTPKPVGEMEEKNAVLLYADLSTANPAAMKEIVVTYKRRVSKGVQTIERFRSLRLALLDLILDADDNIKIVQTALAQD